MVKAVSFTRVDGDTVMLQLLCGHEVGPLPCRPYAQRPDACPTCERTPEPSPLAVLLLLTDASGSTLRLEHDTRDGRTYLTVAFDGHEAPFEVTPDAAGTVGEALRRFAAPVDLSGLRFVARSGEAVKHGTEPVKLACGSCGLEGVPGAGPCQRCGR